MKNRKNLVWMTIVGCIVAVVLFVQPWALHGEAKRMSDECDRWLEATQLVKEGRLDWRVASEIREKLEADARKNRDAWAKTLNWRKGKHYIVPGSLDY